MPSPDCVNSVLLLRQTRTLTLNISSRVSFFISSLSNGCFSLMIFLHRFSSPGKSLLETPLQGEQFRWASALKQVTKGREKKQEKSLLIKISLSPLGRREKSLLMEREISVNGYVPLSSYRCFTSQQYFKSVGPCFTFTVHAGRLQKQTQEYNRQRKSTLNSPRRIKSQRMQSTFNDEKKSKAQTRKVVYIGQP